MTQFDIRLIDKDDPNTAQAVVKEIKKATSDASDKYETFVVTHDPIDLKEKLSQKKRLSEPQNISQPEDGEEINDENYTDQDEDGLGL